MYHFIIKQQIRTVFKLLSEQNVEPLLKDFSPQLEHIFPGNHSLGGKRHTLEGMRRWFKRLFFLFPELHFNVKEIVVRGWPWDTLIAVEWMDEGKTLSGEPYSNYGTHFMRLKWGRLVSLHAYLDTQVLEEALSRMARQGIENASAAPIED